MFLILILWSKLISDVFYFYSTAINKIIPGIKYPLFLPSKVAIKVIYTIKRFFGFYAMALFSRLYGMH
jgi:hypothetical protein